MTVFAGTLAGEGASLGGRPMRKLDRWKLNWLQRLEAWCVRTLLETLGTPGGRMLLP